MGKCCLCGSEVTYEGLNVAECAGSASVRYYRTRELLPDCENYKAPAIADTLDFPKLDLDLDFNVPMHWLMP